MNIFRIISIGIVLAASTYADTPKDRAPADASASEQMQFYLSRLKDENYWELYGEGNRWYIAAEELGRIGKPAIPHLIDRLGTSNEFEKTLALYALRLASQTKEVKTFAGLDYIETVGSFPYKNLEENEKIALEWWEKYKHHWDAVSGQEQSLKHPKKQEREQNVTGQSATCSDSDSEGDHKPQPESEECSR